MDHLGAFRHRLEHDVGNKHVFDSLTLAAAVGSGVVGGVLFGFSAFIMRALDQLPADRCIEAMQSINRQAPTAGFMLAMFATAALAVAVGVHGASRLDERSGAFALAGAVLYLLTVVITVTFHQPRNLRLASVTTPHDDADEIWRGYTVAWTAVNHVRTALAIGACALLVLARSTP